MNTTEGASITAGEFDEPLPQAVQDAAPGEFVVLADVYKANETIVWRDGDYAGVIVDESAANLSRGSFAAWSSKAGTRNGTVGFFDTVEEAAEAIKALYAPADETDSKGRRIVTAKGKRYVVGTIVPARPKVEGVPTWIPEAFVNYWSERNGEIFGATRHACASRKPGTIGRAIWDAVNR